MKSLERDRKLREGKELLVCLSIGSWRSERRNPGSRGLETLPNATCVEKKRCRAEPGCRGIGGTKDDGTEVGDRLLWEKLVVNPTRQIR